MHWFARLLVWHSLKGTTHDEFLFTLLYTADIYETITVFALMHVNVSRQATQHCLIIEQTEAMQLERII